MQFFNEISKIDNLSFPVKLIRILQMVADQLQVLNINGDIYLQCGEEDGLEGYQLFLYRDKKTFGCIQHVHREIDFGLTGIMLGEELKSKILSYSDGFSDVIQLSFVPQSNIDKIKSVIGEGTIDDDIYYEQCLNVCRCCGGLSEMLIEISLNFSYVKTTLNLNNHSDPEKQTKIQISFYLDDDDDNDENSKVTDLDPVDKKRKPMPVTH